VPPCQASRQPEPLARQRAAAYSLHLRVQLLAPWRAAPTRVRQPPAAVSLPESSWESMRPHSRHPQAPPASSMAWLPASPY
jgi:hypothetical protein